MNIPERGAGPAERVQFLDVAAACKATPGAWYKVRSTSTEHAASSLRHKIKTGIRAAFRPAGNFDAYAIKTAADQWDVFAGYKPTALADSDGKQGPSSS